MDDRISRQGFGFGDSDDPRPTVPGDDPLTPRSMVQELIPRLRPISSEEVSSSAGATLSLSRCRKTHRDLGHGSSPGFFGDLDMTQDLLQLSDVTNIRHNNNSYRNLLSLQCALIPVHEKDRSVNT